MPQIDVVNSDLKVVGSLSLSDEVFADNGSSHVVWEVVRHHLAGMRRGTHATKTRGMVSGGGKKPWRQKGTGRARVGSSRNPLWRHGGITQGPQPRNYDYSMPRSKRRSAVRRVVSSLVKGQRVMVLDSLQLAEPKTRLMRGLLEKLGVDGPALLVVEGTEPHVDRASANLPGIKVVRANGVNAYDLLKHRRLLATTASITRLQEVLSR